jgi:hypothetical protein
MEADWEFDVGGDSPLIEAYWLGLVDLRAHPERVSEIRECRDLPGLSDVLLKLNAAESAVWTSKTDVFFPEAIDPYEMNASADEAGAAIACYVDLLPRAHRAWSDQRRAEEYCRRLCARLADQPLRCCRVDIAVRRAAVAEAYELGATAYATACGSTAVEARQRLSECLLAFAATVAE